MSATATAAQPATQKPAKQSETVKMTDGREVEFVGKRKQLKEEIFDSDGNWLGVRFDFRNGKVLNWDAPSADAKLTGGKADGRYTLQQLAAHGALQKFGDETAGTEKLDDMVLDVEDLMERVSAGEWSVEREGGGGMAGTSVLLRALVISTGKTYDEMKAWAKGKTKAQKDALRNSDRLRPIVQKLEA